MNVRPVVRSLAVFAVLAICFQSVAMSGTVSAGDGFSNRHTAENYTDVQIDRVLSSDFSVPGSQVKYPINQSSTDQVPDMAVAKFVEGGQFYPGGEVIYRLEWLNQGSSPVTGVVLTDTLPAAMAYMESYAYGGTGPLADPLVVGNQVIWQLGNVPPSEGGVAWVSVAISTETVLGSVLTNHAEIGVVPDEEYTANNTATHVGTVAAPGPELSIYKSLAGAAPVPGGEVTYFVNWANYGAGLAGNVIVTDTLPDELTYLGHSGYAYTPALTDTLPAPTLAGNQVIWDLGDVEPGWDGAIFVQARVAETTEVGSSITNYVTIATSGNEADTGDNHASWSDTVMAPEPDMGINLGLDSDLPYPGGQVRYSLGWYNQGTGTAASVYITATLPPSTTYASQYGYAHTPTYTDTLPTPMREGNQVIWDLGDIEPAWNGTIFLVVDASPDLPPGDELVTAAEISIVPGETNLSDNATTRSDFLLAPSPDLWLDKTLLSQGLPAGAEATYRMHYHNQPYGQPASRVVLTDTLPSELSFQRAAWWRDPSMIDDSAGSLPIIPAVDGNTLTFDLGTVPGCCEEGYQGWVDVTVHVPTTLQPGTVLTNTAAISTAFETNPLDNRGQVTGTVVAATHDLAVDTWQEGGRSVAGGCITYTVAYYNAGNVPLVDVVITDTLPLSTTFLFASGPFTPTVIGDQVVWHLGSVPGGGQWQSWGYLYVVAQIDPGVAPGTVLQNQVEGTTNSGEDDINNNQGSAWTTVVAAGVNLSVSKWAYGSQWVGSPLTYTIQVVNQGSEPASGVAFTDTLPTEIAGAPYIEALDNWACVELAGRIVCQHAFPIATEHGALEVQIVVTPTQSGPITNTVVVSSQEGDVHLDNNSYTNVTHVVPPLPPGVHLRLDKTTSPQLFTGVPLSYTLSVYNEGAAHAYDTTLTDPLPAGVEFAHISNYDPDTSCNYDVDNQTVSCDLGVVFSGSGRVITILVTPTLTGTLWNTATVAASDVTAVSAGIAVWIDSPPVYGVNLDVTKFASGSMVAGQPLTYTIDVTNNGNQVATEVVFTDTLPSGHAGIGLLPSTDLWVCSVSGDTVTCNLTMPLPAQESAPSVHLVVTPTVAGPFTNVVEVTSAGPELAPDNNVFVDETVQIVPSNNAPIAVNDTIATPEDTPVTIEVLANDTDLDGDVLLVLSVGGAAHGTVKNQGADVTYSPAQDFHGTDAFTYTVSDGNGGTDTATVTVTVTPVNDPPVASDDTATTAEDTPVTIDVLANDTDLEGDDLSVSAVAQGSKGTVVNNGTDVIYAPAQDFHGTDTFTYTVSDGNGGTDTATVTVTVSSVNDPPNAVDDVATTAEDVPVTIDVLANDTDPDGDSLIVLAVGPASNGTTSENGARVTYLPTANFHGTDTFSYTVSDGHGGIDTATVTITVSSDNASPNAVDDIATTTEDVPVTIDVLANDTDLDGDVLLVLSVGGATHGTVTNQGADVAYSPAQDFHGADTFTYTVTDGNGGIDTATVTVTVTPVNDPPNAVGDVATTAEDVPVTIDVLANDTDLDGDVLLVLSVGGAAHGTVTNQGADVTYSPALDFHGTDTFTYTVSDGNDGIDTATVTVTVTPVNDPPVAIDDIATTAEDTPVTIDVLANDTDLEGDSLTILAVGSASNGTTSGNGTVVTYSPGQDFHGTDAFTYTVSDGHSGTDTATVNVTVTPVNDPPFASDDTATTDQNTPVTIEVLANDTDVDGDSLVVANVTAGHHGTTQLGHDDTVTYRAQAGFTGTDTFTYTVSDGNGGNDTATVTVTVLDVAIAGLRATHDEPTTLGRTTHFTATVSAGTGIAFTWHFGDSTSAKGAAVTHIYWETGIYSATVTAANQAGSISVTVQVSVTQPTGGTAGSGIVTPGSGGTVNSTNGATSIFFPPGATSQPVTVTIDVAPGHPVADGFRLMGQSFQVEARALNGAPVTIFEQPFTLVVGYDDSGITPQEEADLQIYVWNSGQKSYQPIVSTVDPEANTVTATLQHLAEFALLTRIETEPIFPLYLPAVSRSG